LLQESGFKRSLRIRIDVNTQSDFKTGGPEASARSPASAEKIMNVYGQSSPPVSGIQVSYCLSPSPGQAEK